MTIKRTIHSTELEKDIENIKAAIDEQLEEALDPDAYATRKMFDKIKNPDPGFDSAGFDELAWDNDIWVPNGTKYIP